ncbi:MAG: peptide/nickel transport system ATP-binding protein, partial [Ilumatobacter sp.]
MTVTEPDMGETSDPTEVPPALSIDGLEMSYVVRGTPRKILRGVTFEVRQGEAYGLVGESGCGKSTTAYAALRYLPGNGVIDAGRVLSGGEELTAMSGSQLR